MNGVKKITGAVLATGLFMASAGVQAAFSDQTDRAFSGTIACGGNHFNRQNGTEAQRTSYVLRNYGDTPVRIEQMTMYDATGAVIFSANGATLPLFDNAILGPGNNTLNPNETAQINTNTILGDSGLGRNIRPVTMKIDWASDTKTLLPDFVWVRFSRDRIKNIDPNTGAVTTSFGKERGRHLNNCRSIVVNKGRGRDHDDD